MYYNLFSSFSLNPGATSPTVVWQPDGERRGCSSFAIVIYFIMIVTSHSIYSSSFFVIVMSFFCCIEPCSLNVKNVQGRIYPKNGQESCLFWRNSRIPDGFQTESVGIPGFCRNSWIPGGFRGFRPESVEE
jgi:hypothetical protein